MKGYYMITLYNVFGRNEKLVFHNLKDLHDMCDNLEIKCNWFNYDIKWVTK